MRATVLLLGAALPAALAASPVAARPAQCDTTDDGAYRCDFRTTDRGGSFVVYARGKPDYSVVVGPSGLGSAFVHLGPRDISLAGPYRLDPSGSGCWISVSVGARICAK